MGYLFRNNTFIFLRKLAVQLTTYFPNKRKDSLSPASLATSSPPFPPFPPLAPSLPPCLRPSCLLSSGLHAAVPVRIWSGINAEEHLW